MTDFFNHRREVTQPITSQKDISNTCNTLQLDFYAVTTIPLWSSTWNGNNALLWTHKRRILRDVKIHGAEFAFSRRDWKGVTYITSKLFRTLIHNEVWLTMRYVEHGDGQSLRVTTCSKGFVIHLSTNNLTNSSVKLLTRFKIWCASFETESAPLLTQLRKSLTLIGQTHKGLKVRVGKYPGWKSESEATFI